MSFRKSFVFIDEHIKTRRLKNHKVNIYRVKNNQVSRVHEFYYTSAATPGAYAEVLQTLCRLGEIPKNGLSQALAVGAARAIMMVPFAMFIRLKSYAINQREAHHAS